MRRLIWLITNAPRAAWLRLSIWEAEHYLRDCKRDGLVASLHLDLFAAEIAHMRVRLALLQLPRASA